MNERKNALWSKTELILALDFYLKEPRCTRSNQALFKAATRIGRSAGSLYARLQNFKSVDPRYPGLGLTAGINTCKPVWDEYADLLMSGVSVETIVREVADGTSGDWYSTVRSIIIDNWGDGQTFSLSDIYSFKSRLAFQFPNNNHIEDKIRQTLQVLRDAGEIQFSDNAGNYKLKDTLDSTAYPFQDGFESARVREEGSIRSVVVNAHERNIHARMDCIRHYGCRCAVCTMSFAERYGTIGEGFIHVHHLEPLASIAKKYIVDPIRDLIPVCPNCHAMLHSQNPPLTIEELRERLI